MGHEFLLNHWVIGNKHPLKVNDAIVTNEILSKELGENPNLKRKELIYSLL